MDRLYYLLVFSVLATMTATAQELPPVDETTATLAHCLVAEADAHTADYAPILSVLANRATRVGSTPVEVARRYCAALHVRRPSPRQVLVLALPEGDGARAYARAWQAAVAAVRRFRSPVCRATHWGSVADGAPRRSELVDCGPTANVFYRESDRPTGVVSAQLARGRAR
jgi:hypothetical protein